MEKTRWYPARSCDSHKHQRQTVMTVRAAELSEETNAAAHGAVRRMPSPPVSMRSTLITSAPMSANSWPHVGPAITCVLRQHSTNRVVRHSCLSGSAYQRKAQPCGHAQLYNFDTRQHAITRERVCSERSGHRRSANPSQWVQHLKCREPAPAAA